MILPKKQPNSRTEFQPKIVGAVGILVIILKRTAKFFISLLEKWERGEKV